MNKNKKLLLPCLRGRLGDWIYYVTIMTFREIANRSSMTDEIHKNMELSRWIQREVTDRSNEIVEYLVTQEQRFFNSIIFGIYGGRPSWQEINIEYSINNSSKPIPESDLNYLNRTFGILNLSR